MLHPCVSSGFLTNLQVSTPGSRFQPWVLRWERRPPTIGLAQFLMIFQCRYSFWHGQQKKQHPIWWTVFSTFCQLADIKGFCWGWFFPIVKALPFGALEKQPADTGGKKHKLLSFLHPTAVAMPIHSKHLPPWLGKCRGLQPSAAWNLLFLLCCLGRLGIWRWLERVWNDD